MPTQTRLKSPKAKSDGADQVLQRLERMIRRSDGFTLGFVKCNHPAQQQEKRKELLVRLYGLRVLEITLDKPIISLLDELNAHWDTNSPPNAVCVYSLEKSINEKREASPVLGRLNNDRDLLRRAIPVPLLIWLPDFALDFVARGAPDFWAWRSGVYEFASENMLWQQESLTALRPDVLTIDALNVGDKNNELVRLEDLLRTAQALPRQSKREKFLVANLLSQMGLIYHGLSDWDRATEKYEQSLKIAEEIKRKHGIASNLHNLGIVQHDQGHLEEAARLYQQSLKIEEELGDKNGIASSLHSLGLIQHDKKNLEEAIHLYLDSLIIKIELNDSRGVAATYHQLGQAKLDQGELEESERLFQQSLKISEALDDKSGIAHTLHGLGSYHLHHGDLEEATRLYQQSIKIKEELGDKRSLASSLSNLGLIYQVQKQFQPALQNYTSAWLMLCGLHSPKSSGALKGILEIREQVGKEQFGAWLMEDFGKKKAQEIREKLVAELAASPKEAAMQSAEEH